MVVVKVLGLVDLAMALSLGLMAAGVPIWKLYILVTLAHAIKATIFIKDVLSVLDLAIVAYTLVMPFIGTSMLTLVVIIFLLLKGAYSFA